MGRRDDQRQALGAAARRSCICTPDTGDRKDGHAADHVARQYLGSIGKVYNGIVAVTSLWADEQRYHALHVTPYMPVAGLADGKRAAAFHTKPQIALDLIEQAIEVGIRFHAIVSDCFYMVWLVQAHWLTRS